MSYDKNLEVESIKPYIYEINGDEYIICENASYVVRNNEDESVIETIDISQNEQGIDTEDRILCLKRFIQERFL